MIIHPISLLWCISWSLLWFGSVYLAEFVRNSEFNLLVCVLLQVICVLGCSFASFMMFALSHDTAHGSISSIPFVNEFIGRYATLFLYPAMWSSWRYMHLQHHKHTNNPTKDPDHWVVHVSKLPVFLKSWAQTYYYGIFYWKYCSPHRPLLEVAEFYTTVIFYLALPFILYEKGFMREYLQYCLIPSAIALTFIAYYLDVVPHEQRKTTPQIDPYKTTSEIKMMREWKNDNPVWFSLLLQFQDYHFVHHLHPSIPSHQYRQKYIEKKDLLETKDIAKVFLMG